LANLGRGQVGHEEKEESITWNVQVEIDETVREKPETSDKSRELNRRSKGSNGLRQAPKRIEEQDTKKPNAAQAAGNAGFRETLEVIIVGVIDDFSVVESLVSGEDQLEGPEPRARPGMIQENAPGVGAHGGAFSNGHFEGLQGRESFDELLHTEPRDHEKCEQQNGAAGEQVFSGGAAKNQP
jgi:hypothetical protein